MKELHLFTDGSVDTRSKTGYGAFLWVADTRLSLDLLMREVKVQRFEQTSSTRLELQTLLWALGVLETAECKVTIYSDSQNIISLPARRERLESRGFSSQQKRPLNNHQLYRDFYHLTDQLDCRLVKVRGHQAARQDDFADRLFPLVDRAARQALREGRILTARAAEEQ